MYFDTSPHDIFGSVPELPELHARASVSPAGEQEHLNQGENTMATAAVETRETASLIGSDKVEGTNVYRSNGDKIGAIERIMIDKQSGKVGYAVMSFGGFLGIGHDHYPVPWSL
jgi:sporulation protein YlmC with PRC-barrel domain